MAGKDAVRFAAPEYQADGSIRPATYEFAGSSDDGWEVRREGRPHLQLGPGYRLLRVSHCGVCATDLARRHLPFPLPQVTGHEVVARDPAGDPCVVEINASHRSRGLPRGRWCAFCAGGLDTHCPDRLVLGIHDLLGGFSPWILAPIENVIALPATINALTATLIEPFAAALHAVNAISARDGDRVAVLGPGRLGSLVIAALAASRAKSRRRHEILAIARRPPNEALVRALGADEVLDTSAAARLGDIADIVVETTGNPEGVALAIRLATREVHIKSTTGQPSLGLSHLTELVVDELTLAPYREELEPPVADREARSRSELARPARDPDASRVAAVLDDRVAGRLTRAFAARGVRVVQGDDPARIVDELARDPACPLGAADLALVTSLAGIDAAIRPVPGVARGLVRARGTILVADVGQARDALLDALLGKGLRISATRCGDFGAAIDLLADPDGTLGQQLGPRMVTDVFAAERLVDAFRAAASPRSLKVITVHPGSLL